MNRAFLDLSPLLNPKSIAIVGASERHGSSGRLVLENLHYLGYSGEIYAINPKSEMALGHPCYKNLESIGRPIDMVAILINATQVMSILKSMVALHIPAAWILASGFSESGAAGEALQKEVSAYARENGLLILGPNCIGTANLTERSATYSVAINPRIKAGEVSVVMQSGAILMGLANSARFGFRYLISCGNQAVLEISDFIGYLANDPQTKVIMAFVEGIPDAQKFIDAVRAAGKAGKPVLILKVGRSEAAQRAVRAHTGSLAGSDRILDAVLNREGVIRANSLDELVETTELFLGCEPPDQDGICLVSLSGGQIGLAGDLSQGMEIRFPEFSQDAVEAIHKILPDYCNVSNPLDAWGNGDLEKMIPGCIDIVSQQEEIGLIAISRDTPLGVAQREIEQSMKIAEAAADVKKKTNKNVMMFSNFSGNFEPSVEAWLRERGIPYLQGAPEALFAMQALEKYAFWKKNGGYQPEEMREPTETAEKWRQKFASSEQAFTEIESRALLADYGIRGPLEKVALTADEAEIVAEEIGFPVVMKILSPDIQHKTESGGVKVGIKTGEEARQAFAAIISSVRKYDASAKIEGVIVQEMISSDAVEVILGVIQDPAFGPAIVFGSGGVLVELLNDSSLALAPVSKKEALAMIHKTRGVKLLKGFRGRKEADIDALAEAIVNLSHLALDLQEGIAAMEINPLMVLPQGRGVCAVDALIERKKSAH